MKLMEFMRRKYGMTRTELARRAKVGQPTISLIELGRYSPYDVELQRIADALGWKGDLYVLLDRTY